MNCFAHALPFLEDPYFAAGACLPDWLGIIDRRVRARESAARPCLESDDPRLRSLAGGVIQHHRDDRWFHETPAFVDSNYQISDWLKSALPEASGMQTHFTAHIAIEMLLDDWLHRKFPGQLARYYELLAELDGEALERATCRIVNREQLPLAPFVRRFFESRFLYDYGDDEKLRFRLNQVMGRARLPALGEGFFDAVGPMRQLVAERAGDLLVDYPLPLGSPDGEPNSFR